MPDRVTVGLKNSEQLADLLAAMPIDLSRRTLDKAVGAGGNVFKNAIRQRAPVGRTRKLKKSVRSRKARAGVLEAARAVGPSAPHAHLVERGHALVWVHPKTGKRYVKGHVPGHPFVRPAADAAAMPAVKVIGDTLADGVEKVARTHGAKAG